MSARMRVTVRSAALGAAASALWLAGAGVPARAAGQPASAIDGAGMAAIPEVTVEAPAILPNPDAVPNGAEGSSLIANAGLKRYAMSDRQLGTIRGGMSLGNGINLNFGFEELSSVNGTLVQGILVQNGEYATLQNALGTTACSPCSSGVSVNFANKNGTGGFTSSPQVSFGPLIPITSGQTISSQGSANDGQTTVETQLTPKGIFNSIGNIANNQLISQATVMNIDVTGLAEAVAAEQAVNSVLHSVTRAVRAP